MTSDHQILPSSSWCARVNIWGRFGEISKGVPQILCLQDCDRGMDKPTQHEEQVVQTLQAEEKEKTGALKKHTNDIQIIMRCNLLSSFMFILQKTSTLNIFNGMSVHFNLYT